MDYLMVIKQMIADGIISQEVAAKYIPELKESEDDRIRKEIISAIKEDWPGHTDWIAWLERQVEQKPTDKVEPKFKIGDKIVENNEFGMIGGEITDIDTTHYELDGGGTYIPISRQDNYRLVRKQKRN